MRKNIYIKDSDLPLFERAEKMAGDSLSNILAKALKTYIQLKETEAKLTEQGYETLTIDIDRPGSQYIQTKQFEGKWIIPNFQSAEDGHQYSVARTKKGRIAVTHDVDDSTASDFKDFDDLKALEAYNQDEQFNQTGKEYPDDLINAIAIEFGEDHVEVMDI